MSQRRTSTPQHVPSVLSIPEQIEALAVRWELLHSALPSDTWIPAEAATLLASIMFRLMAQIPNGPNQEYLGTLRARTAEIEQMVIDGLPARSRRRKGGAR